VGDGRPDDDEADALLESVGAAFSRLRRHTSLLEVDPPVTRKDRSRELVINIVDEAEGEMTVGGIAEQLAVDPSVASKMVTDCINGGYLERRASQRDGRRTVVGLTRQGIALRDQFRSQYRQAFVQITQDWPEPKRRQFARLLVDYVEACTVLTNSASPKRVNHG
jgi:DNA-binding MarR family transcriptional regulator